MNAPRPGARLVAPRRGPRLPTIAAIAVVGFMGVAAPATLACTTFLQTAGTLVGKSYDWHDGSGQVLLNPRGLAKRALVMDPGAPLEWTSRFASLTFNQYGRELPNGGLNEAGLVVEIMWLRDTTYPLADARPAVSELQLVQHLLDTAASVDEAVAAARRVRVSPLYATIHWLICDATGHCAALEYLDGQLVVTDRPEHAALTNDPYAECAHFLGGSPGPDDGSRSSKARFARAAARGAGASATGDPVAAAFATLDAVSQGSYTQWQIVYDPASLTVHWRTQAQHARKSASLRALAADCSPPEEATQGRAAARLLDIDHEPAGDATGAFTAWTGEDNRAQLTRAVGRLRGPRALRMLVPIAAGYPTSLTCSAR